MAQATISARIDEKDKMAFDEFCSDVGLNTSAAINLFIKAVLRESMEFKSQEEADNTLKIFTVAPILVALIGVIIWWRRHNA